MGVRKSELPLGDLCGGTAGRLPPMSIITPKPTLTSSSTDGGIADLLTIEGVPHLVGVLPELDILVNSRESTRHFCSGGADWIDFEFQLPGSELAALEVEFDWAVWANGAAGCLGYDRWLYRSVRRTLAQVASSFLARRGTAEKFLPQQDRQSGNSR